MTSRHGHSLLSLSYTLLLYFISPLLLTLTVVQALRTRDSRYLRQRFGFYQRTQFPKPVWIHAASVGEVIAAEPLVHSLKKRFPQIPIIVTTGTPAGGEVARLRLAETIDHAYLPIDFPGAVRRFLRQIKPACALIMETELWLNLYRTCSTMNIAVLLINGRLSSRTLNAQHLLHHFYATTLASVDMILARSATDKDGFVALGASPDRVKVIGNIKFAAAANETSAQPVISRPYVLMASTHDNEELRILKLWKTQQRRHLLVIAPRHPDRLTDILKQLQPLSDNIAVRSRNDPVSSQTEVYIIDTVGELTMFMASADLVFMGGSLVRSGGHNILEPARLGKTIVFGPHMDNFLDESEVLLAHGAAIQISDDEELKACLARLLESKEERDEVGARAQSLVQQYQDVAERYVDEIEARCNLSYD